MSRSLSPGKGTPCDFHPYQSHTWIQLHEVVVDKEYQLECARDELQKLAAIEQEGKRKDEVISALRKEIAEYKKCTQSGDMRYASMEEKLSSSDSHLRDRMKEVQMLQLELESVREQLKTVTSKSTAIRKERSRQSQSEEEVRELRKQQRSDEESIATLKGELAEKKKHLQSMQERLKKFRSENQDLKSRLESAQAVQDSKASRERQLKAEIDQLKNHASNAHLLQAKYNFSEQELLKAKDKENTMAAQLGRLESELSEVCGHILASFQVSRSDSGHEASSRAAFQVVTQFAEAHFKTEESLAQCEQDLEKHKEDLENLNTDVLHLCKCWKEFQEGVKVDGASAVSALVESVQRPANSDVGHMKELLDVMRESITALHISEDQTKQNLSRLESHIKNCYEGLQRHTHASGEEDAATMVTSMKSLLQSSLSQVAKLKERLVGAELEHSASLSGAVTALRQDEEKRMSDAVDRIKSEEEERLSKELENLKELHAFEKEEAILQEQEIAATLSKELEALKLVVESERQEREAEKSKLLEMETKLLAAEHSKSESITEARGYKERLQQQLSEQVSEFKEQAQQYALTIVAMEEKLLKLMETCKTLQADNQGLTKQLESATTSSSLEIKNKSEKIGKMEELIQVLRSQLGLTSDDAGQKEVAIKLLEDETTKLKQDMKDHKALIQRKHEEEIADLQLTMAKQEAVMACQKEELENLNESLSKKTTELADKNHESNKIREEMAALQKSFESSESVIVQQSHRVLLEAGHVCLGDNHCQTIENQRTAIAQLRERLNELELAKPPVASHQATLKELSRVRHELMKVKSEMPPSVKRSVVESVKSSTFKLPTMEASMSRDGATHQLQDTLECSERMYHNLVEAICKGMPDLTRCPVEDEDHLLATDEQPRKKQVLKERKKFADTVCRKLTLQARQQAKLQASITSAEGGGGEGEEEENVGEKSPQQVIADLEAVLSSTAEQLEQQKRLNQSLLRRKKFKESQFNASMQRPRHKCVTYS